MRATVPSCCCCCWTLRRAALIVELLRLAAGRTAVARNESSTTTTTLCDVIDAVGTTGSWAGNPLYEMFVFDCADGAFLSGLDVWGATWISNLRWRCSGGEESDMYPVDEYLAVTSTASFSVAISALEITIGTTGNDVLQQLYVRGYDINNHSNSNSSSTTTTTTWIGPIGEGNGDGDLHYTTGTYCEDDDSLATGAVMWANDDDDEESSCVYSIMLRCAKITSTCVSPGDDRSSGVTDGVESDDKPLAPTPSPSPSPALSLARALTSPATRSDGEDMLPPSSSAFLGDARAPVTVSPYEAPPTNTFSHIKQDNGDKYAEVGGLAGVICLSIAGACICGMMSTFAYLDWRNVQRERRGERGFYPQDLRIFGGRGRGGDGGGRGTTSSALTLQTTEEGAHITPRQRRPPPPPPPPTQPSAPQTQRKAEPGTPVAREAGEVEGSTVYATARVVGVSPSAPPLPETVGVVVLDHPPL